jgi:hypothetical protein
MTNIRKAIEHDEAFPHSDIFIGKRSWDNQLYVAGTFSSGIELRHSWCPARRFCA